MHRYIMHPSRWTVFPERSISIVALVWVGGLCSCVPNPNGPERVIAVDFSFLDGDSILLSSSDGALHRSDDAGLSWQVVSARPAEKRILRSQTVAATGDVWGILSGSSTPDSFDVLVAQTLAVARDGGASIVSTRLPLEVAGESIGLFQLVSRPEGDPLLFANGRFFAASFNDVDTELTLEEVGTGTPEIGRIGTVCGRDFFVASRSNQREPILDEFPLVGHVHTIWRSEDGGQSWREEFDSHEEFVGLECGDGGGLWLLTRDPESEEYGSLYRRTNDSESWDAILDLGVEGIAPARSVSSLAASNDGLLLSFTSERDGASLIEVLESGRTVSFPPIPDAAATRVRVDSEGGVWLAASGLFHWDAERESWEQRWE